MSRVTNDVDTLNQLLSQGLTQLLGSLFGLIGIVARDAAVERAAGARELHRDPAHLPGDRRSSRGWRGAPSAPRARRPATSPPSCRRRSLGIREAQAFNRTETNIARFRERNRANRDANVAAVAVTAAFAPTIDVLSTLAIAVVIGFGGYLLLAGQLSVGVVAAFLIYVQQFFRPIQLVSQVYTQLQAALAGAERIYAILDEPEEAPDPPGALVLDGVDGRVTFDGVWFGYDPTRPVLRDISFEVAAGQTVALVGRTGAGKTTIANLIPRFYDVEPRGGPGRWSRRAQRDARQPAGADGDGPAGAVPVRRDRRREHRLRPAGRLAGADPRPPPKRSMRTPSSRRCPRATTRASPNRPAR